jgi:lytic murein transglycosylase
MARHIALHVAAALLATGLSVSGASAAPACQNTGSFDRWLDAFRKEAAAAGVTPKTIASALGGMTLDQGIIARDRRQSFFSQSFLDFSDKLVRGRPDSGRRKVAQRKAIFEAAEKQYGVPASVITAFWALESDFGTGMGNLPVLRSLTALAYDCRRGEMFRGELLAALKIIDRGDLRPEEMIGSWAGELGQTQFLPTHYLNHAIDFDRDGRRDLMRSDPDIIGSTSAFIVSLGWKRGEPWLEEVRVPAQMAWDQADLAIQHPRAEWAKRGVTMASGKPLTQDQLAASLLLPMGRNGPAFLAYPNFRVYLKWNQSLTYALTAAYLATRIDGAPAMGRGKPGLTALTYDQLKDLHRALARHKLYEGEVDGKLGAGTRASVKAAQLKLGLPADSYPTPELLERLGGERRARPAAGQPEQAEQPAPKRQPRSPRPQ